MLYLRPVLLAQVPEISAQAGNRIERAVRISRREVPRYGDVTGIAQDEERAVAGGLGDRLISRITDVQVRADGALGQRTVELGLLQAQLTIMINSQARVLVEHGIAQDLFEPLTAGSLGAAVVDVLIRRALKHLQAIIVDQRALLHVLVVYGPQHAIDGL
jgi:hypothetical protein